MLRLKALAASILCAVPVGWLLRRVYRDRVPARLLPGVRVHTDSPAVPSAKVAEIFWGIYESAELRFVSRHLRGDLDAVELGSSIGVVSGAIARRLEPARRLVCTEANPSLLELLGRNARDGARAAVEVDNRAVAYDADVVRFAFGDTNTGGHAAGSKQGADDSGASVEVGATTLSRLLADHDVGDYVLVADIEGAEAAILEKDAPALARCRQLVIELHDARLDDRPVSVAQMRDRLAELGMRATHGHGNVFVFER